MKKQNIKICIITLFFGLVGILNLIHFAQGYSFYLFYFNTNRDDYHISGCIEINATWDLYFDPALEEMYVQIQIYDSTNVLIWNSSKFDSSGSYDEFWIVNITKLSYARTNESIFHVKFFQHYLHKITLESIDAFVREKKITIHTDRFECQLQNFRETLTSNDILDIEAKFYDILNGAYIANQEIFFEMLANDLKLYEYNLTTNFMGEIELSIDVFSQMSLGNNTLRFTIPNSQVYNNTIFEYNVFVGPSETISPLDDNLVVLSTFALIIAGIMGLVVYKKIKKTTP